MSHITAYPSIRLAEHIPQHIRIEYPNFYEFLKLYFQVFEEEGNGYEFLASLEKYIDIDQTTLSLLDNSIKEKLGKLDKSIITDDTDINPNTLNKRTLIKNIRQYYRSVGSEKAFRFIFQAKYKEKINIYYPWDDVLKISESTWTVTHHIKVLYDDAIPSCVNGKVVGLTTGSQGIIETVNYRSYSDGTNVAHIVLKDYDPANSIGGFEAGEEVVISSIDNSVIVTGKTIISVISGFDFTNRGMFLDTNDTVFIEEGVDGIDASFTVGSVKNGGIDNVRIIRRGTGYKVGDKIYATSNDPVGDSFYAGVNSVDYWGGILTVKIYNEGSGYFKIPFLYVESVDGQDALLQAEGVKIGAINSVNTINAGINYDGTPTSPDVYTSQILTFAEEQEPFRTDRTVIGILSESTGYVTKVDNTTNKLYITDLNGGFEDGEIIIESPAGPVYPTLATTANGLKKISANVYQEIITPYTITDDTLKFTANSDFVGSIEFVELEPTNNVILNGTFDYSYNENQPRWNVTGGWDIFLGTASCNSAGIISQNFNIARHQNFKVSFDVLSVNSGDLTMSIGEGTTESGTVEGTDLITLQDSPTITDPGHYEYTVYNDNDTTLLGIGFETTGSPVDVEIDNVIVTPTTEQIANGDFRQDRLWTKGAGWSITGSRAEASSASSDLSQDLTNMIDVDTYYDITIVIEDIDDVTPVSGSVLLDMGGTQTPAFTEAGTYSFTFKSGAGSSTCVFTGSAFTGAISDISIIPTDHRVVNDTFDLGLDGWTNTTDGGSSSGWAWHATNLNAYCTGDQSISVILSQDISDASLVAGDYVKITFTTSIVSGTLKLYLDGNVYTVVDGANSIYYTCGDATLSFALVADSNFEGTVDDISCQEVTSNNPETLSGTELVGNGDFADGTVWDFGTDGISDTGWYYENRKIKCDGSQDPTTSVYVEKSLPDLTDGQIYYLYFTVEDYVQGSVWVELTETSFDDMPVVSNNGVYGFTFRADATNTVRIHADSIFIGSVSNIHVIPSTNFIANSDFSISESGADRWWSKNSEWNLNTPGYAILNTGNDADLNQAIDTVASTKYEATIVVDSISSGGIRVDIGGTVVQQYQTTPGTYVVDFEGTGAGQIVGVETNNQPDVVISEISVVESDQLVSNPNLESASGWTNSNWTFTTESEKGIIDHANGGGAATISQTVISVGEAVYEVEVDVVSLSGGDISVNLGGTGGDYTISSTGTNAFTLMSGTDSGDITISVLDVVDAKISRISIKPSDQIIENGNFSSDHAWTIDADSGWTIANGRATHKRGNSGSITMNTSGLSAGQEYLITYRIIGGRSATFMHAYDIAGEIVPGALVTNPGSYTSFESHLNYDKYIQDSYYFQKFSYQINSDNSSAEWKPVVYDIHPAGTIVFGNDDVAVNRLFVSYTIALGPYITTLELYKFDNLPQTQNKDFDPYSEYDVEYRPKIKTRQCPGSELTITVV